MVKIIAAQRIPYGKQRYDVGEEIEASEKDARLLVHIGKATLPETRSRTDLPSMQVQTREVVAEKPEGAAPEAPTHPQTYSRRDMTAESAGQTGLEKRSPSSLPARRRKGNR